MKTNPNDCAFPFDLNKIIVGGLTKREYFAAMALQGMLSSDHIQIGKIAAINAIRYADDLINQLNEKPSS